MPHAEYKLLSRYLTLPIKGQRVRNCNKYDLEVEPVLPLKPIFVPIRKRVKNMQGLG